MGVGAFVERLMVQEAVSVNDAQGGVQISWTLYRRLWTDMHPVRTAERLQAAAMQSAMTYRFRVSTIDAAGVTAAMRVVWTPQWPRTGRSEHTLEIRGVLPEGDGHQYTILECGEIA